MIRGKSEEKKMEEEKELAERGRQRRREDFE